MKIYLVRHGEAVSPEIDPEKPLSPEGRKEVEGIARAVGERSFPLSAIYHSEKLRAKQTAEIMQEHIAPEVKLTELPHLNPNDPIDSMLTRIEAEEDNLMVVGHLPYLAKLCGQLVDGNQEGTVVNFQAGTTACLEELNGDWAIDWVISSDQL